MKTISKTIQKGISKSKYLLMALLVVFSVSCSTEDGNDGATGPQGPAGTNGTDGNANVQIYDFDVSTETGTNVILPIPNLTEQMVEENAILVSYTAASGLIYMAPGPGVETDFVTKVFFNSNLNLGFRDYAGGFYNIVAGEILSSRVFIIEPSASKTSSNTSPKQQIYNELHQAGIDLNDYHAVCDYYGIAH